MFRNHYCISVHFCGNKLSKIQHSPAVCENCSARSHFTIPPEISPSHVTGMTVQDGEYIDVVRIMTPLFSTIGPGGKNSINFLRRVSSGRFQRKQSYREWVGEDVEGFSRLQREKFVFSSFRSQFW